MFLQHCVDRQEPEEKLKKPENQRFSGFCGSLKTLFVGTTRFELATSCTPCKRATGLRYVPKPVTGR